VSEQALALENGVRLIGCAQSLDLNGMSKDDLGMELSLLNPSNALPTLGVGARC
jgi:uncharacterized protein